MKKKLLAVYLFYCTIAVIIPIAQLQAAVEEARDDPCNRLLIRPEEKQPVAAPVGVQNETVQEQVQMKDFQVLGLPSSIIRKKIIF